MSGNPYLGRSLRDGKIITQTEPRVICLTLNGKGELQLVLNTFFTKAH